jgi:large subunit ribosomal protein L28
MGFLAIVALAGILVGLSGHPWHGCWPSDNTTNCELIRSEEFSTMAAVCDVCGKSPGFGKSVSHSHRRTSRRWDPNIQIVHVVTSPGGNKKRMRVCTSCLKAGKVVRG